MGCMQQDYDTKESIKVRKEGRKKTQSLSVYSLKQSVNNYLFLQPIRIYTIYEIDQHLYATHLFDASNPTLPFFPRR